MSKSIKILLIIVVVIMILFAYTNVYAEYDIQNLQTRYLGDINQDGVTDEQDYKLLQDYILGYDIKLSSTQMIIADIYSDGKIDMKDLSQLKLEIVAKNEISEDINQDGKDLEKLEKIINNIDSAHQTNNTTTPIKEETITNEPISLETSNNEIVNNNKATVDNNVNEPDKQVSTENKLKTKDFINAISSTSVKDNSKIVILSSVVIITVILIIISIMFYKKFKIKK